MFFPETTVESHGDDHKTVAGGKNWSKIFSYWIYENHIDVEVLFFVSSCVSVEMF